MKKVSLLLILLLLPAVAAVQISMNSNFSQGETLTANISGNFMNPIQPQNILLYQGHINLPFIPYVLQENGIYYVYGQLMGKTAGNYSLVLSGARYFESGKIQSASVYKNFTISNASADFYVAPGFVTANSGKNFSISVTSLSDNVISISSSLTDSSGNISSGSEKITQILPGETHKIYFSLAGINISELNAMLDTSKTSYQVPVFVSFPANQSNFSIPSFSIQPVSLNVSLATNSSTSRYIYVSNNGNVSEEISMNISKNLNGYVYIFNNSFSLSPNETKNVKVDIASGENNSITEGFINVTSGSLAKYSFLTLNFSKSYTLPNESLGNSSVNNSQPLFQTCAQLGGINCTGTSTCNGIVKNAQDGQCCLGTCTTQSSGSNAGRIILWLLVAVVIIFLTLFLIRRYGKAKHRKINFLNFAKKNQK